MGVKVEPYWLRWLKAALVRALKTWAQAAVALIGSGAANVISIDWPQVLGISATAAVVSILTSLAGLPEVKEDAEHEADGEGGDHYAG